MAEPPFRALPRPLRLYLWTFAAGGLLFVGASLAPFLAGGATLTRTLVIPGVVFLALNAAGARTRIQLRGEVVQSLDTTTQFAMIVLFPPAIRNVDNRVHMPFPALKSPLGLHV